MPAHCRDSPAAVAADASNHHYDLPPRIFELFLDENLKYSVGLFEGEGDTLEAAQFRKMNFIADELGLGPGSRALDVGCGWGSLVTFLARRGCDVTGITPSTKQTDFVNDRARAAGLSASVHVRCGVFEDQAKDLREGSFDGITFVGSIVHMPDKAAVLERARRLLRHRGRLYLSETCFRNSKRYERFAGGKEFGFIRDAIFGWGDCVPVSRYVTQLEDAGFSLCGLVDLTANYRRTIEEWRRRAELNRAAIDEIRPGYSGQLLRYFDICNASWGFTTKQYALIASSER